MFPLFWSGAAVLCSVGRCWFSVWQDQASDHPVLPSRQHRGGETCGWTQQWTRSLYWLDGQNQAAKENQDWLWWATLSTLPSSYAIKKSANELISFYTTPLHFSPETFPRCVLEISPQEVEEYYSPKDFQVGQRVRLLGRTFLLCDCDGFTEDYYKKNHPDMEMKTIQTPEKKKRMPEKQKVGRVDGVMKSCSRWWHFSRPCSQVVAPYNGFGSLEDSLQNCLSLIPEPPRRNVTKMLDNSHKVLRYSAILVSP